MPARTEYRKPAADLPANYTSGEVPLDTAMDLETNAPKGVSRENSLLLRKGELRLDAVGKMAQTVRSGTNDIDALDYAGQFPTNDEQADPDELNELYVLVNFRPAVTKLNGRMDCGVAGYDNTFGLPPFFPTRLRFEDYIYRLWVRPEEMAAAHVDAAQNHTQSNCMRNPVAAEIFNDEVCNLLKRKIKDTITRTDDLTIGFDFAGEATAEDARQSLDKLAALYGRALEAAEAATERFPRDPQGSRPLLNRPGLAIERDGPDGHGRVGMSGFGPRLWERPPARAMPLEAQTRGYTGSELVFMNPGGTRK